MVFEYMEYGDLTELLRSNDVCWNEAPKVELKNVSYNIVYNMVFKIELKG